MFDITEGVVSLLGIGRTFTADASLSSDSNVTIAAPVRVVVATWDGSGESILTVPAPMGIFISSSSMVAESDLESAAVRVHLATVSMSAESSLNTSVIRITEAIVLSAGSSDLTAVIKRLTFANIALEGASSLTADATLRFFGESTMSAESDLTATSTRVIIASTVSMSGQSNLPAVTALPIYRLVLPVKEYSYTENVLLKRYPVNSGVSLLITGTDSAFGEFVSQNEIKESDYYFGGGRRHQLNQVEYDAVVAAGVGDLVEVA